jgi:acyl-CoA thioesterase-1
MKGLILAAALLAPPGVGGMAHADVIGIVALGASNTAGLGVGTDAAWPALLEAMLRRKGHKARVVNAGISGDDTGRMRRRLDRAVPPGTRLVILDKATSNDRVRGIDTDANVAAMTATLRARGAAAVVIPNMHDYAGRQLQPDGIHITAAGHAAVAARLLPQV